MDQNCRVYPHENWSLFFPLSFTCNKKSWNVYFMFLADMWSAKCYISQAHGAYVWLIDNVVYVHLRFIAKGYEMEEKKKKKREKHVHMIYIYKNEKDIFFVQNQ